MLAEMRPGLHRYCARMMGSAFDGEDVVQEALAKAAFAYDSAIADPRRWLLRVAHNAAIDALRRRRREARRRGQAVMDEIEDSTAAADVRVAAAARLSAFLALPPLQRGAVILTDVLGHPMAETAGVLEVSEAAAKAALHRGRLALRRNADAGFPPRPFSAAERVRLQNYADRFNARDFSALRDLLAEDVRLDLANRARREGRDDVATYFARYAENRLFAVRLCLAEGRLALAIADPGNGPDYVVQLEWGAGRIREIRDYRYAPYIGECLAIEPLT